MMTSLKNFLFQIIDYAGLYPPANLMLDEAFANFVRYQKDADSWMLSRFIIPARRLTELAPFKEDLSFSALGRGGEDADKFLENLKLDIADILRFRDACGVNAMVDMFEVALPAVVLTNPADAHNLIKESSDLLNKNGLSVFFEAPFGEGWQMRVEYLIRALRKLKDKHIGFKLRTGGVTANAFPSIAQVAWAIMSVRDAGVPVKCTAGLHHPVRHFNEGVLTKMHGFMNVFAAGTLAVMNNLSVEEIQSILEDEDPASFIFDETGFSWKDLRVVNSKIEQARGQFVSFGSCSFDEPREDLRNLKLM